MSKDNNNYKALIHIHSNKLPILCKSIIIGLFVGIVITAYRLTLMNAEEISFKIYAYLRNNLLMIPIAFLLLGLGGYIIGLLLSKNSMISGSGIPQVKGVIMGYFNYNWLGTLIAKFFGGTLAILAGLSLGREGPSIQLGACVGQAVGEKFSSTRTEKKMLIASGASAGLAAAFNAPLAGVMFVLEEVFKYFSPIILLSTMVSAVVADFISKSVFGMNPVFSFDLQSTIPLSGYWLICLLGIALGIGGAIYNYILLQTQKLYKKLKCLNVKTKPIIPFMIAGIIGLLFPIVLGSGHSIIEELHLSTSLSLLILILIIKFLFSMISFGSGTPGGIFFPLLIMGATIGAIFGNIGVNFFGFEPNLFYNFVVLAMAGYFTAIVRAPITGSVLLIEMTGSFTHLLALTFVSLVAYVVADLLKSTPIYESLLENQISEKEILIDENNVESKTTVDLVVHYGSIVEEKLIKEIDFPKNCLLIAIKRGGKDFIPRGDTRILAEDHLIFITDLNSETKLREMLDKIATF